ncbi:MAG: hypothetical protein ABIH48_02035 [Candidatus Falkowbacteria bacterium]
MPTSNLSQPEITTKSLSETAKDLFRVVHQQQTSSEDGEENGIAKIKVHEIVSKMSFFYEKIRNAVDYKDDHLLRKNAIERILKRLHLVGHHESNEIANMLIVELIRGGYLNNNVVPETKADEVALIIERFLQLRKNILAEEKNDKKEADNIKQWIWNLTATNIEENLINHSVNHVIGKHMYSLIDANIADEEIDQEFSRDKKIQIYLAIYGKLFNYDDLMLEFLLFRYFNPNWYKASDKDIANIAQQYQEMKKDSVQQLSHPFRKQVQKLASRYTIYFSILKDAIEENPEATYDKLKNSPEQFKKLIAKICDRRYKESHGKLSRGAVRSIIYIFLTKAVLVFILEGPIILFLGETLNYFTLSINILFPPALLFLIILFTAVPGNDNTKRIYQGIEEIVFQGKHQDRLVKLYYPVKRGSATNIMFSFFYIVTFLLSFGLVVWGLLALQFHFVSIIIFVFFLSLVSFFGIRLGKIARAYSVVERKENLFSFFANFFYVPIVGLGKWLSETFSQINVFVFILDFIIESPFKIFVEITEQWSAYVKERKEGIVE